MTEIEARDWLHQTFGGHALGRLERFAELLLNEADRQSLVARSTFSAVWSRHIADSAQLVLLGPSGGAWLDIGSGGGLPGIVVAVLRDAPLVMVEPRRKRVAFLNDAISVLGLTNASAILGRVQTVTRPFDIISARAVSHIDAIFTWTRQLVSRETRYILPRGENAVTDMAIAQRAWHGVFHVEKSITDPRAGILLATGVCPR